MPCPSRSRSRRATKPALDLSPFQAVRRDFAFVVDSESTAGALTRRRGCADRKLITGVSVFDVFEGAALGEGKKSIAIEVTMQPIGQDADRRGFRGAGRQIVENVAKQTGGVLRS